MYFMQPNYGMKMRCIFLLPVRRKRMIVGVFSLCETQLPVAKDLEEIILPLPAHFNLAAIHHYNGTTITLQIFADIFKVYKVGFMWAHKAVGQQHFFHNTQVF